VPSIRWRRLDLRGTDRATLAPTENGHILIGHAQFQDPQGDCDLHYSVVADSQWRTREAHIDGLGPFGPLSLHIVASPGQWRLNGERLAALDGSIDVDLAFTPATNLLSIRRLALEPGQSAEVVAAWLAFPASELRPLRQIYDRLPGQRYAYRCPDLPFESELRVDGSGFVTSYPPLWISDPRP